MTFPTGAPARYEPGATVAFDVASWSMSPATDVKDTEVVVSLGDEVLGRFALDNTVGTAVYDDYGTASVAVQVPSGTPAGPVELVLTGASTGTEIIVPVTVFDRADSVSIGIPNKLLARQGTTLTFTTIVVAEGRTPVAGTVTVYDGGVAVASGTLTEKDRGVVRVALAGLGRGVHKLSAVYSGSESVEPSTSPRIPVLVW